ncbi:MAG: SDR family oxidoreductase [Anaerolineales bacterium]|nr:SDR family oxidoreductase [Anaerolineales bacterium]
MSLEGKIILVTGAARRIGRRLALAAAQAGADLVLHHGHSPVEADRLQQEIHALDRQAIVVQADLEDPAQVEGLIEQATRLGQLFGLVNNAAIFSPLDWNTTKRKAWDQHLAINLTAPFLLSQALARQIPATWEGRIVNILDWRALRPGPDHLPYTISKAGLAALTRSLAQALAPRILVNAIALGAILPPSDGAIQPDLLDDYPLRRWAELEEVEQTLLFLLDGPAYITGEIIHLDGGRHLV